ncbi:MAG: hypothetical protein COA47_10180 [Robiginitomaculum sp.]|nr:MAG: hypothetical protein COA47_10180 [Robiginitomaculum sp.]
MSTKQKDNEIKANALVSVIRRLENEQCKLRYTIQARKTHMRKLTELQTRAVTEIAQLGELLRGLKSEERN